MAIRLLNTHPTSIKIQEVLDLMEKLDISVEVIRDGLAFHDKNMPGWCIEYLDIEDGSSMCSFPPSTEYKLIITED